MTKPRQAKPTKVPEPPKTFEAADEVAINGHINHLMERSVMAHLPFQSMTPDMLIRDLFEKDVLDVCRAAFGVVALHGPSSSDTNYPIYSSPDTYLSFRREVFTELKLMPPHPDRIGRRDAPPFMMIPHMTEFQELRTEFAWASYFVDWFNKRNVTANTIRAYCPWFPAVAPHLMRNKLTELKVCKEPPGIGPLLDRMRRTNTFMASALLIPQKEKHEPVGVRMLSSSFMLHINWNQPEVFVVPTYYDMW